MKCVKEWSTDKQRVYALDMGKTEEHSLVAVGLQGGKVKLCDPRTGSMVQTVGGGGRDDDETYKKHKGGVWALKWSPGSPHVLVSGDSSGQILLWDVRRAFPYLCPLLSSSPRLDSAHQGAVTSLSFSPQSPFLVSAGTDHRIRLWDLLSASDSLVNFGSHVSISAFKNMPIAVSPGRSMGGYGASLLFSPNGSGSILVSELHTGRMVSLLKGGHYGDVNACELNPVFPNELYSCGNDNQISVWTPESYSSSSSEEIDEEYKPYWDTTNGNNNNNNINHYDDDASSDWEED